MIVRVVAGIGVEEEGFLTMGFATMRAQVIVHIGAGKMAVEALVDG